MGTKYTNLDSSAKKMVRGVQLGQIPSPPAVPVSPFKVGPRIRKPALKKRPINSDLKRLLGN